MMRKAKLLTFLVASAVVLTACAPAPFRVVQIPERSADLYPLSESSAGVTVAIDEIDSPSRSEKFFGIDLTQHGILPINVLVSNRSEHKVEIKPADVVLLKGQSVSDPVPTELVGDIIKREYGLYGVSTEQEVEQFVRQLSLTRSVVRPGNDAHGVMFFSVTRPRTDRERVLTVMELFRDGGLAARVAVTDLESSERLHFGPFSLSYTPRIHTSDRRHMRRIRRPQLSDPRFSRF